MAEEAFESSAATEMQSCCKILHCSEIAEMVQEAQSHRQNASLQHTRGLIQLT